MLSLIESINEKIERVRSQTLRRLLILHYRFRKERFYRKKEMVAKIQKILGVSQATAYDYANTLILLKSEEEKQGSKLHGIERYLPKHLSLKPESEKLLHTVLPPLVKILNWATYEGVNPVVKRREIRKNLDELLHELHFIIYFHHT